MKLSPNVLHISESLSRLGGVETLVKQMLMGDEASAAAAILDTDANGVARAYALRKNKLSGGAAVRRMARTKFAFAEHIVFHNFAGLMMLASVIPHRRKCVFIHTNSEDIFSLLPERLPYIDSILVSGEQLKTELHARFPELEIPVTSVQYPLGDQYFTFVARAPKVTLTIGYSGRLENEQKQVMRLVQLCEHLSKVGVSFRMEIAGTGSALSELKAQIPSEYVRFLGMLDGQQLYEAYARWDFMVCTSDYETGPLVVMEAMATGALPIMPDIPCQATDLLRGLDFPLYQQGSMLEAAQLIVDLVGDPRRQNFSNAMIDAVADRRTDRFMNTVMTALGSSASCEAYGLTPQAPTGVAEYLPFSVRRNGNAYLR